MPSLHFDPIAESFALVAIVAAVLAGLLLVLPRGAGLGAARRLALVGLRAAVIALVILAMLRPTLVYTETRKQDATLVLLADRSRSMTIPDGLDGKTRWESLRGALGDAAPALQELSRDFKLKAYTFDAQTQPAETKNGRVALDGAPEGRQTAIGAALDDVLGMFAGQRLLGVILLSDGSQRAMAPRDKAPQNAASQLKDQGDPLYTVVFGQSRGSSEAQDVAVKELLANSSVFIKNDLAVSGVVRIDGYVNREVPLRLSYETAPGKMEIVAEQSVRATADGQQIPFTFHYVPQVAGEFKLTVEASPQPGELSTTNNQLSTFVNVLKGGLNVLYIEGAIRVEQKFIRRALDASPEIKLDYIRLDPREPGSRPADLAERFKPGKYEVYMLGDVDSTAFRPDELTALVEAVKRGAGLIMLGGFHSFGPGGYAETPLAGVLPVVMDRLERQTGDGPPRTDVHVPGPLQMKPTAIGSRHFALMLAGTAAESAAQWAALPPLEGANRFVKIPPSAVVLADAGPDVPLLISQPYANGRVMAMAADSTWHWWMRGFESAHKRFWRQLILWLARKDQSSEGSVWVRLEKRRFAPGERVEFSAGAQAPGGETVAGAQLKAEIVMPDGSRNAVPLKRDKEQITGSFRNTEPAGDYAIEVTATDKGQMLGTARARFLVFPQDLELDNASADATTMASLAAMGGGEAVAPEQLGDLIRRLARNTESLEISQVTKKTFWDTWLFFLTLVGLLSVEWYLRKRWGLV